MASVTLSISWSSFGVRESMVWLNGEHVLRVETGVAGELGYRVEYYPIDAEAPKPIVPNIAVIQPTEEQ